MPDPSLTHLIVAAVLTVVSVVITALIWKRAQVKTVFWWIGASLVPMAVYLVGLAPATVGAYDTLRQWWGTLTFSPIVITGFVLAGLATMLIAGSRLIPSESYRDRRAALKAKASTDTGRPAASGGRPTPAVAGSRPSATPTAAPGRPAAPAQPASGTGDAEMDEIAELLRKRGIN